MKLCVLLVFLLVVFSQNVPTGIPGTFHAYVTYSYSNLTLLGPEKVVFSKGQNMACSMEEHWMCRYNERLVIPLGNISNEVLSCNYAKDPPAFLHVPHDGSPCISAEPDPPEFSLLKFPPKFAENAYKFSQTVKIDGRDCTHWNAQWLSDTLKVTLNVDAYFADDIPCQISVGTPTKMLMWSFVGYTPSIPLSAREKCDGSLSCAKSVTCVLSKTATEAQKDAVFSYACSVISCYKITEGNLANATKDEKVNWLLGAYYVIYGPSQGDRACDFGGAGQIVILNNPAPLLNLKRNVQQQDQYALFPPNLVCRDAEDISEKYF